MAKKKTDDELVTEEPTEIELRTDFSHYGHAAPQAEVLYGRFHKAILAAGYEGAKAVSILHSKFDEYMKDMHGFCAMLDGRLNKPVED